MMNKEKSYKGYESISFDLNGYEGFIVIPSEIELKKRWIWRTEFLGDFDKADMTLVKQGWHLVYYKISDMYGCPMAVDLMADFHRYIVNEFGLSKKTVLFGFSRGGLYAINYAVKYPSKIAAIYLDAPVIDIQSWPKKGHTLRNECLKWYGFTESDALKYSLTQLDRANKLAEYKIPIIIVVGDKDQTVPYEENGKLFIEEYKKTHDDIVVIIKEGCNHHPHSLEDITPLINFIINN